MEKQRNRGRSRRLDLRTKKKKFDWQSSKLIGMNQQWYRPYLYRDQDFLIFIEDSVSEILSLERSEDSESEGLWWSR